MAVTCKSEKDLYQLILDRIEDRRKEEQMKPDCERTFWAGANYTIFQQFGFSAQVNYDIQRFLDGKKLGGKKSKPLHENRLKILCEKVGIQYKEIYYLVEL